jgi:fatty-acyl-CoA synthase
MEFNLAEIHEAIAEAIPDRECLVAGRRRFTWAEVTERTRRLANHLCSRGLGVHRPRSELAGFESGQDHLGLYLFNGNEYLEGMLGAFKARVAPFNVNYRYVEEELRFLLDTQAARGIIYHASLAPRLAAVLPSLPKLEVLIQVADESGHPLLPGAVDYEAALTSASPARPGLVWSPDDLYVLCTGGTTGLPKGVLWRQADIFCGALGGELPGGAEFESLAAIVERARAGGPRVLPAPPFMHGAAHWVAFGFWNQGGVVLIQDRPRTLDPDDVLSTLERERGNLLLIVGDAFAQPILDQLRTKSYDLSSFVALLTGGAPLNAALKQEFLRLLPKLVIIDAVGSSETGSQAQQVSSAGTGATTGTFLPGPYTRVLSEDLSRILTPGDPELGWFAKRGRVPLGYLGDPEKTGKTFPVVQGVRYSVPGDRARLREDGVIELLGRDSVTINSGGEKIFAEEVEHALKSHPAVYDAVVTGRPSERWGQEVVAIVQLRERAQASEADLLAECGKQLARYKLPKAFVFRDEIVRSPSGKADYRWAREQATAGGKA